MPNIYLDSEDRRQILSEYGYKWDLHAFIETGTNDGGTPLFLKDQFSSLYTIELDPYLWRTASQRLRPYPHITCLFGDSGKVLGDVLSKMLKEPALVWLDGHHSGPGTARGDLDTPVRQELETLFADGRPHVILVDDARIFKGEVEHELEPHYADYPSLDWVREVAEQNKYDYELADDIVRLTPKVT